MASFAESVSLAALGSSRAQGKLTAMLYATVGDAMAHATSARPYQRLSVMHFGLWLRLCADVIASITDPGVLEGATPANIASLLRFSSCQAQDICYRLLRDAAEAGANSSELARSTATLAFEQYRLSELLRESGEGLHIPTLDAVIRDYCGEYMRRSAAYQARIAKQSTS